MTKTYTGGCHCGKIAFEADLDLADGTYRCNCTYCRIMRTWIVRAGGGGFRDITGGADIATYKVKPDGAATFHFCPHCGVRIGTAIDHPQFGRFFNVSVGTLESATVDELLAAPVGWIDGLHDRWTEAPDEVRHL